MSTSPPPAPPPPESNPPPVRLHSILKIRGHHPSIDDDKANHNGRRHLPVLPPHKTEHDEETEKPALPSTHPPIWRNITVLLLVAVAIRFVFVVVAVSLWSIPVLIRKESEYPPSTKFFYPSKPHKSIDPSLEKFKWWYFIVITGIFVAGYVGDLLQQLAILYIIFYLQRKSIVKAVKECKGSIIFQSVQLAFYFIGAINFFMSGDFLFAFWIDFLTILPIVYLLVLRIKWYNSLIKRGISNTKDMNSVDPEGSSEPHKDGEAHIKNDPDYQALFGNKKDKDDRITGSIGSSGGFERDSSAAELTSKENVITPAPPVKLGSDNGSQDRGSTPIPGQVSESHHLVEKHFTTTTIIKTEHPHHRDKHHANKTHDKHNKKKHVKKHSN